MKCSSIRFKKDKRRDFLTRFIVQLWNSLLLDAAHAKRLDGFKRHSDTFMKEKTITGY